MPALDPRVRTIAFESRHGMIGLGGGRGNEREQVHPRADRLRHADADAPGGPECHRSRFARASTRSRNCSPVFFARDPHRPLHVLVGQSGFGELRQRRQEHLPEEPAHLFGDLPVERLGGDRLPLLLLGNFLLGLMIATVPKAGLRPHDRRHHAPFLGLGLGQAAQEGLGVGIRGEDVELADRDVVRLRFGHVRLSRIPEGRDPSLRSTEVRSLRAAVRVAWPR